MKDKTQHLELEQIKRLLNMIKEPSESAEASAANAHLADCPLCREAFRREMPDVAARVEQLLTPTPDDTPCLDKELIVRYVYGDTDAFETEMVEIHLEDCAFCTEDVAALRAFQEELEAEPQFVPEPAGLQPPELVTPSSATVPVTENDQPTEPTGAKVIPSAIPWWKRRRERLVPVMARPMFPLLAGAALATCIIYVALVMPIRAQLKGDQETHKLLEAQGGQIQSLQKEITGLKQKAATAEQQQAQLEKWHKDLIHTQRELALLKEQQRQNLLVREASTPDKHPERPFTPGPELHRVDTQPFPPALAKYLHQPQLAFAEGIKSLAEVATEHSQNLGGPQEQAHGIEPISPVACVISTQRPQFQWRRVVGAIRYQVEIRVPRTNRELDPGPPTSKTTGQLNYPLSRGVIYGWQVVAQDNNDKEIARSPLRSFKVLDAQTAEDLKRFAGSPLALSVVYAKAGMPTEAEQEVQRYLRQNPHSARAQKLLEQIHALQQKAREAAQ